MTTPVQPTNSHESKVHPHTAYENLQDSLHGIDEPMEESHPKSTFVMIYGAYPLLLLILILAVLAIIAMF